MAAQDLCTLADVRAALELPSADTSRDTLISTYITRASEVIMNEVDREFAPATASATRRLRVDGLLLNLAPYDLRTVATFTLNPETTSPQVLVAGTDYELLPVGSPSGTFTSVRFSGLLSSLYASPTVFSMGHALCDISGAWGFASVPEDVKQAAILTVSTWLRRDVTALALASESFIDSRGLSPALPSSFALPRDAEVLLGPFYRLRASIPV